MALSAEQQRIYNLVRQEAQAQGCDLNIALATCEAETTFTNILGDHGDSLGPFQVQPRWHNDAFVYAANKYLVDWPSTHSERQKVVLGNDGLAVAAGVYVVKQVWASAGKDFRQFSLQYVGPAIPDSDYQRRRNIWLKYQGMAPDDSPLTPVSSFSGSSGNGGNNAAVENQIVFPPTNFSVLADSQRYGNVLYGRRYRVIVSNANGIGLDVSDLRCTFSVRKVINQQPPFSEVVIYNLSAESENFLLTEGNRVVIEAGYEGEQYGVIFDGDVVQTVRDKENGTDYRLTLYALPGDRRLNFGFVIGSIDKGQSARQILDYIGTASTVPIKFGSISDNLTSTQLTRGKVMFGMTRDYLRQLQQSQNATLYAEDGSINFITAEDLPEGEVFDLSPDSGLIGVPAQSELGVTVKSLLNPRLKINGLVHIDNSLIRAQAFNIGHYPPPLARDGLYRICGITHTGDTRGTNWYTECTTVSQAGGIPGVISTTTGKPW
ncbi:hypothetical protein LJK88_20520 [Paenibacillus sp. P26]|nr:hypothetical protein LJK88_20520 [Paenibacillus sp. P26]UUZ95981.1 hypothetical protein LJK87_17350 [Paenibacillus sp. P25]